MFIDSALSVDIGLEYMYISPPIEGYSVDMNVVHVYVYNIYSMYSVYSM